MAGEIGVLVVHGMGEQKPTFAYPLIGELEKRLEKMGVVPTRISWQHGYWADLLNQTETDLWERLRKNNDLDWRKVRRFFINAFGDAVAYRRSERDTKSIYQAIHDRMLGHLRALRIALGGRDAPLIVIAHSLGSVIMSDYTWNEQSGNDQQRGTTPLEKMETLSGFVTFGSNIPLFTLALPKVESITFPPVGLPKPLADAARWLNFYDPDDVLGWPLKPLSPSYNKAVYADRAINVGNVFTSWNPVSHSEYWTDDDFTKPTAELIAAILKASEGAPVPVAIPRGVTPLKAVAAKSLGGKKGGKGK